MYIITNAHTTALVCKFKDDPNEDYQYNGGFVRMAPLYTCLCCIASLCQHFDCATSAGRFILSFLYRSICLRDKPEISFPFKKFRFTL